MALDWQNERYVRLYRPTADHAALCWQARVIWPLLLQEADGAGVILTRKGARGLAAAICVPLVVVQAALEGDGEAEGLLADGCLVQIDGGYMIPRYVEAQTAPMSDSQRKARQRDRERAELALATATGKKPAAEQQAPAPAPAPALAAPAGHATSRDVTPGHAESREPGQVTETVTPSRAEPSRDLPPAPARAGGVGLGALVEHAHRRLNAARLEIDPTSQPLPAFDGGHHEGALVAHLRKIPEDRRQPTLDHAIDVMVAAARAAGVVDDLRLGQLAGPRVWEARVAGSVRGAGGAPRGRDSPPSSARPPSPDQRVAQQLDRVAQLRRQEAEEEARSQDP